MLQQIAEKQLSQSVHPRLVLLSPILDLVAVATSEHQVDVFRFGGERAFGTRSKSDRASVLALCWEFTGSQLAIWWDDNTWQRLDSWTGQARPALEFFPQDNDPIQFIEHVSWQAKLIDPATSSYSPLEPNTGSRLDLNGSGITNGFGAENELRNGDVEADPDLEIEHLPKLLASFDVTDELPRLSALPQVYDAQLDSFRKQILSLFSKQELLDSLFQPASSNIVDMLLLSHTQGCFNIGQGDKYRLGAANSESKDWSVISLASHPSACCQAVLTTSKETEPSQDRKSYPFLDLRYLSLNALESSGVYVPIVDHAVNQICMLSSYVTLCVVAMRDAWKTSRDVFSRFVANIEGTLAEYTSSSGESEVSIVTALYRLATTGACGPQVEEWIVEILGLKGIERWYTAYTKGLVQTMNLMHSHLLPALDRTSIEASRLRAISCNPHVPICQITAKSIQQLLDDTDTLRTLTNTALLYARQEIPQLEAFASFLRCQYQMLKEPNSTAAKDSVETFAALDHAQLLSFITGPMTKSHLNVFFGRDTLMIRNAPRRPRQSAPKRIILSMLDRHAQHATQPTTPVVEFVNLLYQSFFLSDSADAIKQQAVTQFEKETLVTNPLSLDTNKISTALDIRMCLQSAPDGNQTSPTESSIPRFTTYVAVIPPNNPKELRIYTNHHPSSFLTDPTSPQTISPTRILKLPSHTIQDLKFASDTTLFLLLYRIGKPAQLAHYTFRTLHSNNNNNSERTSASKSDEAQEIDIAPYIVHEFESEASSSGAPAFTPTSLQVPQTAGAEAAVRQTRKGRMPKRQVLVLDEEGARYKVFELETGTV